MDKLSYNFGNKEHVLNYTCSRFQLSRPKKVGEVMALIRQCQPETFEDWETWYFLNAETTTKTPIRITREELKALGRRLFEKIQSVIIPSWTEVFETLTEDDCIEYIYDLTLRRTYDGYCREKSVVYDNLAQQFPELQFEESPPELDHAGDIDYIARVGRYQIGLQIKPITANANFSGYSLSERMKASFSDFKDEFGGEVFVVYSIKEKIVNTEILDAIKAEIERLKRY